MKRYAFALGLFFAIGAMSLHGQSIDLVANIPFDFRLGESLMPAGEYLIHHLPGSPGTTISRLKCNRCAAGAGSSKSLVFLTNADYHVAAPKSARLEFNRYGNTYFLTEMWEPWSHVGRVLPRTDREKELARQFALAQHTGIALEPK